MRPSEAVNDPRLKLEACGGDAAGRVDQTQPGRERFPPSGYVQGVMTPEGARPAFCSVARHHAGVG
jgi:hypothetical protein